MSLVQKAIIKINNEVNSVANDYVEVIGEYIVDMINQNNSEDIAAKILAQGKTIQGSLKAMETEAKKIQKGGMAIIGPKRGFEIVMQYFGITDVANINENKSDNVVKVDFKKNDSKEIHLDLDDLF